MKALLLRSLLVFLLFISLKSFSQSSGEIRTVKTPLVVNGKWIQSSYDYDSGSGEYYFVSGGKRVLFDEHFKKSKDYLVNTIWVDVTTITYNGKSYEKYGLPRVLMFNDVAVIGKYKNLLVMGEQGTQEKSPAMIWLPHSATMGSAAFQPYQLKK